MLIVYVSVASTMVYTANVGVGGVDLSDLVEQNINRMKEVSAQSETALQTVREIEEFSTSLDRTLEQQGQVRKQGLRSAERAG